MTVEAVILETKIDPALEDRRRERRKGTLYQIAMCIVANTSVLGPAMGLGYSAVALPALLSPHSELKVTIGQASWIASVAAIATPVGCILSTFAMRRGRCLSMLITSIVSLTGWIVLYFSTNVDQILVGRTLSGIASGLASVPATVYAAEVAFPKLRGIVVTWTSVSIAIGILAVYIFGYVFQENWRLIALTSGLFPLVSITLILTTMPESPVWLLERGRKNEAEAALRKFRGISKNAPTPAEILKELDTRHPIRKDKLRRHICVSKTLKPFAIMVGYFFFQQFSGIFVVVFYAIDITREAGIVIDGYLAAILIGLTRLLGSLSVSYICRKFGRRFPSIISGVGMTLFMAILSFHLYLTDMGCHIGDKGIIPVLCILMYIFTSTLGFLTLPFAMVGEIYPAKVKDIFSGLTTCIAYVFSFVVIKLYPDMLLFMGKHGVFFFYGVVSLVGTVFVVIFLPETKGKTLQEVEELFEKKEKRIIPEKERIVELQVLPVEA